MINKSTDKVGVAVQVDSESITDHLETLVGVHDIGLWHLFDSSTILDHSQLLELLHGSGGTELLSHEERVILLRKLQTKGWISYNDSSREESDEEHDHSRPFVLKMHAE